MDILLNKLTKIYRDADKDITILSAVDAKFIAGKSYAIVGASGVGKSTLLHLLAGLDTPTGGEIRFGDTAITALSVDERAHFRRNSIGFIFQGHHLLNEFSALENVMMPLIIQGEDPGLSAEKASALLQKVGLSHRAKHSPGQLSGGEQQRVAIARALVTSPGVLLADEPTGSLDRVTGEEVKQLLLSLHKELKNTLIVVTHNEKLAQSLDFIYEMKAGGALESHR
jgi:lipoprotein-releasing system ATP-binding protein